MNSSILLGGALLTAAASALASPPADAPVKGGTVTFAVHLAEPSSFDCHATTAAGSIWRLAPHYSSLLKLDPDKYPNVKGDLARSWTVSADNLTYTFKLHPNVKFHDGTPLTSADVKASYDRMRKPPANVVSMHQGLFGDVKAIDTPDPTTVVVKLSDPNAAMLQLLGMPFACVYSAKMLASDADYPAKKVMGSGPFKFKSYEPGKSWEGERFAGYFKPQQPYLDGFRALAVAPPAAVNALLSGQVHYLMQGLTQADQTRVKEARGDLVNLVGGEPTALQFWFAMNTQHPPLNDVRVRRALLLALDHNAGAKAMERFSAVNRVGGLVRPGSRYARTPAELAQLPGYGTDVQAARKEARRLLAEAGHPSLKLTMVNASIFSFLGVFAVDQLRQVGVTVDHRVVPGPQLYARRASGDYDLILDNPPEFLDDPTAQFAYFAPFNDNPSNMSRSNDTRFLELYRAQSRELDMDARAIRVKTLEAYLMDQAYVLPLFWQDWRRVISSDVGGLNKPLASPYLKIDLADVWLRSGGKDAQK
jgi:peptide/nickel transport system substrate-binding protein